ncbi:toll/interleukin-1 receptor domain-containing protein [Corallococcus coralloides]|nr:toll/interleukin-1 receptor domain-containing protein [Corallococcus coralloides]
MPKAPIARSGSRPVFISHAAADKEIVNFFVDTVLIKGIGISHDSIFNTSATSGPIPPGANFTEEIRAALRDADSIIALVTPTYYARPFAMAELGAAWAVGRLVPILVPPLEFKDAEGVLRGTQCFKVDDKNNLSSLYDRFSKLAQAKKSWLSPAGHGTFEEQRDIFLNELPKKLKKNSRVEKADSPSTDTATKAAPSEARLPIRSPEDAKKDFNRLISELRAALVSLPMIVRVGFMYYANGKHAPEHPEHTQIINDAEYRGLLKTETTWVVSSPRMFSPTRTSQGNRDVYRIMKELSGFLKDAPPAFHHEYERQNSHPASLKLFVFWDTHDLLSEGEPGKETASFRT